MGPHRYLACLFVVLAASACSDGRWVGPPRSDASLASLNVSEGRLAPLFDPDRLVYWIEVASTVESVSIDLSTTHPEAAVLLDSQAIDQSSPLVFSPLQQGPNELLLDVIAADGFTMQSYELTFTRVAPPALSSLELSSGELSPAFDPHVTSYTASTGYIAQDVLVTPRAPVESGGITVDGVPITGANPSARVALNEGESELVVRVDNHKGETRDYRIVFDRDLKAELAQRTYIKGDLPATGDNFGYSVSISDDTMVVGEPGDGSVYVFVKDQGIWSRQARLRAWQSPHYPYENFGISTAIDDDTIAVGAWFNSGVTIYTRSDGLWSQHAHIPIPNAPYVYDQRFGFSLALSGDTLAIGAPYESSARVGVDDPAPFTTTSSHSGAVWIYLRRGTTWQLQAHIKAASPDAFDQFGASIALDGDRLVVGAPLEDSDATGVDGDQTSNGSIATGAVYVFERKLGVWSQQAYLKADETIANAFFGQDVSIDGELLAVGAYGAGGAGAAWIFRHDSLGWTQQARLDPPHPVAGDRFGISVSIRGSTAAVGAPYEDGSSGGIDGDPLDRDTDRAGAVYLYSYDGESWGQPIYVKAAHPGRDDEFGNDVVLGPAELVVGAHWESSDSAGIDGDQQNDDAWKSGAVYLFD